MLKKDLEERVAELETENEELRRRVGDAELSEEAILICRGHLQEVGHRGMYFDDVVRAAVQEIKALRYDAERYGRLRESASGDIVVEGHTISEGNLTFVTQTVPGGKEANERPMRRKGDECKAWFALAV